MNWSELIDKYQSKSELTDAQIAADIGLSPQHFSNFKAGRRELPSGAKYNLLNRLGYEFTRDIALSLLPETAQTKIKDMDRVRWKKEMTKRVGKKSGKVSVKVDLDGSKEINVIREGTSKKPEIDF